MFKQTIRFDDVRSAHEFDQHLAAFLRAFDAEEGHDDACVFATGGVDGDAYVRVVQTDSALVLGRLLNYLSARDFPPATSVRAHYAELAN
ncbi:hypothetical protein [Maricaulis sp. W15]|uniref:hypothetical protein n=1 Tax=Maricaulis sp. W15 TaxID=1772333 RepID=UPI00117D34B6|nr:hypothetical protein [Maricaulis sp. W15]